MMEQYIEIKAANPDCLLFYRMGDFYEMFFDDAEVASRALGIVLTKRGKHLGRDIPMCGVPIERADEYLHRLIALGHRVAVCEQLEDPAEARKRGAKSVVRRDVVRLVTPGTLTEDSLLDARRNNYLLALARGARLLGRGPLRARLDRHLDRRIPRRRMRPRARSPPRSPASSRARSSSRTRFIAIPNWRRYLRTLPAVTPLTRDVFDGATAERRLASFFGVATTAAFGAFSRLELTAAAAADHLCRAHPARQAAAAVAAGARGRRRDARHRSGDARQSRTHPHAGRRAARLAACRRSTARVTAAGSRLLAQRLAAPLTDPARDRAPARRGRAPSSTTAPRAATCAHGSKRRPISPARCRASWSAAAGRAISPPSATGFLPPRGIRRAACRAGRGAAATSAQAVAALRRPDAALAAELERALADELPAFRRDGGFVRAGYEPALDEARALRDESRRVIAALQVRYAETTGIRSLKIRHNNVLGYFVDVTAQHGDKLMSAPLNATFIHRQTLAGQVRFTTTELGELEAKIANAADRALALELEIFDRLAAAVTRGERRDQGGGRRARRRSMSRRRWRALAVERDYVRPEVDGSLAFAITGGRHPVVEQALAHDGGPFVANDCDLSPPAACLPPPQAREDKERRPGASG